MNRHTAPAQAAAAIDALDLESIAFRLMHPGPGLTVMALAEADRLIAACRCFLKLCAWYPDQPIVPSMAIDEAWNAHLSGDRHLGPVSKLSKL